MNKFGGFQMKQLFLAITIVVAILFIPIENSIDAKYKRAPGISLENTKGEFIMLSQLLRRSNYIIAFWSTYCIPCKKELPELIEIEKEYGSKKNVKLLLVSVDEQAKKDKVISALKDWGLNRESLLDVYQVSAKNYKIAKDVKSGGGISTRVDLPSVFLVNQKKQIVFKAQGYRPENIRKLIKAIHRLK